MRRLYFVTGATGTVGSALVPHLLAADPQGEVWLLIRARSAEQLQQRVEELHAFWGHGPDSPARGRIRALAGDIEQPHFGLAQADYAALAAGCSHILHCAGKVRMNLPLEAARSAAVASARNVLALAQASPQLVKVEFVSTVGVGGRLPGLVPETWIDTPRAYHNTYEQAKAEAEAVIRPAVERGLPLTVHRPSMVVGESVDGRVLHFQVFYHLCEFLSGRRTRGLTPRLGEARLDIVPADYVGRAIAWSAATPATAGRILHLCSGPDAAIPLTELQQRVRAAWAAHGLRLPPLIPLPPAALRAALPLLRPLTPARTRRALNALPIFLDYLATRQAFANGTSRGLLAAAGIALPPPQAYLDAVFADYLRHLGAQAA